MQASLVSAEAVKRDSEIETFERHKRMENSGSLRDALAMAIVKSTSDAKKSAKHWQLIANQKQNTIDSKILEVNLLQQQISELTNNLENRVKEVSELETDLANKVKACENVNQSLQKLQDDYDQLQHQHLQMSLTGMEEGVRTESTNYMRTGSLDTAYGGSALDDSQDNPMDGEMRDVQANTSLIAKPPSERSDYFAGALAAGENNEMAIHLMGIVYHRSVLLAYVILAILDKYSCQDVE